MFAALSPVRYAARVFPGKRLVVPSPAKNSVSPTGSPSVSKSSAVAPGATLGYVPSAYGSRIHVDRACATGRSVFLPYIRCSIPSAASTISGSVSKSMALAKSAFRNAISTGCFKNGATLNQFTHGSAGCDSRNSHVGCGCSSDAGSQNTRGNFR